MANYWDDALTAIQSWTIDDSQANPDKGAWKDAFIISTAQAGMQYEFDTAKDAQQTNNQISLINALGAVEKQNTEAASAQTFNQNLAYMTQSQALAKDYLGFESQQGRLNIAEEGFQARQLQQVTDAGALDRAKLDQATALATSYMTTQGKLGEAQIKADSDLSMTKINSQTALGTAAINSQTALGTAAINKDAMLGSAQIQSAATLGAAGIQANATLGAASINKDATLGAASINKDATLGAATIDKEARLGVAGIELEGFKYGQDAETQRTGLTTEADKWQTAYSQDSETTRRRLEVDSAERQNTYSQDSETGRFRYGQDAETQRFTYGQDAESARNRYTQDSETSRFTYGQDAETQRFTYGQDAESARNRYSQDAETNRFTYGQDSETTRTGMNLRSQERQIGIKGEQDRKSMELGGDVYRRNLAFDRSSAYLAAKTGTAR
jgi:hypothetical protein